MFSLSNALSGILPMILGFYIINNIILYVAAEFLRIRWAVILSLIELALFSLYVICIIT